MIVFLVDNIAYKHYLKDNNYSWDSIVNYMEIKNTKEYKEKYIKRAELSLKLNNIINIIYGNK